MPFKEKRLVESDQNDSLSLRDLTTRLLAKEYLDAAESNLELRAYALENILPSLTLAMENLSVEVQKRGIDSLPLGGPQVAPAAEKPFGTVDEISFNPLNWLAQSLFRNNPRHASVDDRQGFSSHLSQAAEDIRQKISDVEQRKKEAEIAEQQRIQEEKLEAERILRVLTADRRTLFSSILSSVFDKWTKCLWREEEAYIKKEEIIAVLHDVARMEEIETDARLLLRVLKVTKALETHVEVDTSLYGNSPESDKWIDGVPSETEPYRIARWSRADFSKQIYRLMVGWTTEDLSSIVQTIEKTIFAEAEKGEEAYLAVFKCPSFKETETFDTWKKDLLDALSYFHSSYARYADLKQVLEQIFTGEIPGNTDDSSEMIKTAFSLFSRKVVSQFGMSAYSDLQNFLETQANDLLHGSQDQISGSPDRATQLKQIFSSINTGDNVSSALLKVIVDKILLVCNLDSEAKNILQDWIEESQKSIGEIPLLKHVDALLAALRPLTDDEFAILSSSFIVSPYTQDDANERRKIAEKKALALIESLQVQKDISISDACQTAVEAILSVLEMVHTKHLIQGAVSLIESSSFRNEASEMTVTEFLRFVAASKDLQPELKGIAVGPDSLENQALDSKKLIHLHKTSAREGLPLNPLLRIVDGFPSTMLRIIAVPICNPSKKGVGVLSFKLQGETDNFDEPDIEFLQAASKVLYGAISEIDIQHKILSIAAAAKLFGSEHASLNIEIFLNEGDGEDLYQVMDSSDGTNAATPGSPNSTYIIPQSYTTKKLNRSDVHGDILYETAKSKVASSKTLENGKIVKFIPVMSQEGKRCTTVLMFTGASDNEFDFDRIVSMVVAAFASAKAHTIAEEFGASSAKTLEVEKVDEPARRAVLFSKMMLLNARDSLGKLTSQSIAELKSYKRPPASISRILKGVLYLFGKKPKELGDWNDILKSVNMELLKSMTDFDPTAKHKKRIFKRLEKVLKKLPKQDDAARPESPARFMLDWLLVSSELRRSTISAKKRRSDIFESEIKLEESEAEALNEEEAEEEVAELTA